MKIVFMGTPEFSVRILKSVHEKYGVNLVVSQPDKKVGRKRILTAPPVKQMAEKLGIEVFQPAHLKSDYQRILDIEPDIIITAAYGQMIPNEVLEYPRLGAINVHGSLLPLLRGGAPIERAIMRLYNTTGITIMYMAQKMDSGDIIVQRTLPILNDDTKESLFEKMSVLGEELLLDTLPIILDNTAPRTKQDEALVTYAYNIQKEEEQIDWNMGVDQIHAYIRAFYPSPNMFTYLDDQIVKVIEVEIKNCIEFEEKHGKQKNGTIIKIFDDAIGVKCDDGVIKITKVQLPGKNPQDVKTFMNGSGRNLIKVNKVFKSK